jgi:hypothetical protein
MDAGRAVPDDAEMSRRTVGFLKKKRCSQLPTPDPSPTPSLAETPGMYATGIEGYPTAGFGNYDLQDYQMQSMLSELQNSTRLMAQKVAEMHATLAPPSSGRNKTANVGSGFLPTPPHSTQNSPNQHLHITDPTLFDPSNSSSTFTQQTPQQQLAIQLAVQQHMACQQQIVLQRAQRDAVQRRIQRLVQREQQNQLAQQQRNHLPGQASVPPQHFQNRNQEFVGMRRFSCSECNWSFSSQREVHLHEDGIHGELRRRLQDAPSSHSQPPQDNQVADPLLKPTSQSGMRPDSFTEFPQKMQHTKPGPHIVHAFRQDASNTINLKVCILHANYLRCPGLHANKKSS